MEPMQALFTNLAIGAVSWPQMLPRSGELTIGKGTLGVSNTMGIPQVVANGEDDDKPSNFDGRSGHFQTKLTKPSQHR